MADSTDSVKVDNERWPRFRIYLVGFPERVTKAQSVPVVDMIERLVPEASVVRHNIFRRDIDMHLNDQDEANEFDVDIPAKEKAEIPTPNPDVSAIRDSPEVDQGLVNKSSEPERNAGNIGVEVVIEDISRDELEHHDAVGHSASVTTVTIGDVFSSAWILNEAFRLLERIQRATFSNEDGNANRVLIAGHGFGGIVIKQAIVTANSDPTFYDVASHVASLVFFSTPSPPTDQQTWEELLLDLIKAQNESHHGRLSNILAGLVESVSCLSHAFFRFEAKYTVTNVISRDSIGVLERKAIGNNNPKVTVQWPDSEDHDLPGCGVNDIAKLELLRTTFAPIHLLSDKSEVILTADEYDAYFKTLHTLSTSRRVIYEGRASNTPNGFNALKGAYRSLLRRVPFQKVCGGSVQVIAPKEYGRSAIVKLISEQFLQESSPVIVENFPSPLENLPTTVYSVCVSFIHQIISQRPFLFRHIRDLMMEILHQNVWTTQTVQDLLGTMLLHSQNVDFLVVIYQFDSPLWPAEVRDWWSKIPNLLAGSHRSTCTFLISSNEAAQHLTANGSYRLNLEKGYAVHRKAFIENKTSQLLDSTYTSASLRGSFGVEIKEKIVKKAMEFEGSLSELSTFLAHLFQTLSLTTPQATLHNISQSPAKSTQLYGLHLESLKTQELLVYSWAVPTLSWLQLAVRPLRVEELATASAITPFTTTASAITPFITTASELRQRISTDIERDICRNLGGLVCIENGYARMAASSATAALAGLSDGPKLADDAVLAMACLCYLKITLGDSDQKELRERQLSPLSLTNIATNVHDPIFEFLDYATRYWPTHFNQAREPPYALKCAVIDFLKTPEVAEQWFQLYLRSSALPPDLPGTERQASAIEMAVFVGLSTIVPDLVDNDSSIEIPKEAYIRRGFLEHRLAVMDTGSKYYLECAIANDDAHVVTAMLDADKEGVTKHFPLHMAALAGSSKTVQTLLNTLRDTTKLDNDGRTALHMAAIRGRSDTIRTLLGRDETSELAKLINSKDKNHETPLILATRMGHVDVACLLAGFSQGPNLAVPDRTGKTPMHHAVLSCPQALASFLARYPEGLLMRDNDGSTPLHIAARFGCTRAASAILDSSKDLERRTEVTEAKDESGQVALSYAAQNGFSDVVDLLIVKEKHAVGANTSNQLAATSAAKRGHLAIVKMLLEWTPGIEQRLLEASACAGQLLVVKYLLQKEVSPNGDPEADNTPLGLAASKGYKEIVLTLLEHKADINLVGHDRLGPLHHAAKNGREDVARILLDFRPSKDKADYITNLACINTPKGSRHIHPYYAVSSDSSKIMELLGHRGAKLEADINLVDHSGLGCLHHPTIIGKQGVARYLLDYRPSEVKADSNTISARIDAIDAKIKEMSRLLLDFKPIKDEVDGGVKGASIDAPDSSRRTPLHYAADAGNLKIMHMLLSRGAKLEAVTVSLETPLHFAVKDHEATKMLLAQGAQVNAQDIHSKTPLHKAVGCGNLKSIQLLVKQGADIASTDDEGNHPVYYAIKNDGLSVVQEIFSDQNEDENSKGNFWTDLETAVKLSALGIVKFLIGRFPKTAQGTGRNGRSLLHVAAQTSTEKQTRKHRTRTSSVETQAISVETQAIPVETQAISVETQASSVEIIDILINLGLDVNGTDDRKSTPLHFAAASGGVQAIGTLVAHGADINARNKRGCTPLHSAAERRDPKPCIALLKAGAPIKAQANNGMTALYRACYKGNVRVVEALLDRGADPNVGEYDGWSPLQAAADNLRICRVLVNKGAEINYQKTNMLTPIHLAASWGYSQVVEFFLQNGADPNVRDNVSNTALHNALKKGHQDVLRVMVEHKGSNAVDFNLRGQDGQAPIHIAVGNDTKCVQMLLDKGVDSKVKTNNGLSCLELAVKGAQNLTLSVLLGGEDVETSAPNWDYHELVAAYWMAIENLKENPEGFTILTNRKHDLINEVSKEEGYNGLEVYMRGQRMDQEYENTQLAINFLLLGINPFKRKENDWKSAFELGVLSRRRVNTEFLHRCLENLDRKARGLGLGFRELRIATELDDRAIWMAFNNSPQIYSSDDADHDGWNIHHFLLQSAPRIDLGHWISYMIKQKTRTPKLLVRPGLWRSDDPKHEARAQIHENGREATFGSGSGRENVDTIALRSDFPFPPRNQGVPYYEISVQPPDETESESGSVSVGLTGEFTNQRDAHPGWNAWSLAYHGDDGLVYEEASSGKHSTGERTFGLGNTVGCGIDYKNGRYLFTLDGEVVFEHSSKVIYRKMYPCVGHSAKAAKIKVNFGEHDFAWGGAKALAPNEGDSFESPSRKRPRPRPRRRLMHETT